MAYDRQDAQKWLGIPEVANQVVDARNYVAEQAAESFMTTVEGFLAFPEVESPLEAVFLTWFLAAQTSHDIDPDQDFIKLHQQYEVVIHGERFRLDFAILVNNDHVIERAKRFGLNPPKFAIEVDGHTFHEKTKDQVARRNSRDRLLQSEGWIVLHYSWSEVIEDPLDVVTKSWLQAYAAFWKFHFAMADVEKPGWRLPRTTAAKESNGPGTADLEDAG